MDKADVLVIGSGPAGVAFATAGVASGMRVVLIDKVRPLEPKVGEILPANVRVPLQAVGLWNAFLAAEPLPVPSTVSIWGSREPVERSSIFDAYGSGWFVDRHLLERELRKETVARGATFLPVRNCSLESVGHRWCARAVGAGGRIAIDADFVIQATGRSSRPLQNGRSSRDDRLIGICGYLERPGGQAQQRFCIEAVSKGWWYYAPLPKGRAVAALMTDSDLLPPGRDCVADHWLSELCQTKLIANSVVPPKTRIPVHVRPAGGYLNSEIFAPGHLSIGDAAASYDPLCGQGVVAALSKGGMAAKLLASARPLGVQSRFYAQSERATFAEYQIMRKQIYSSATPSFESEFWRRRR